MLKKVTLLLVVIALLITSIPTVFADSATETYVPGKEIKLLLELGVLEKDDVAMASDTLVSRAEVAQVFVRLLNMSELAYSGKDKKYFYDVDDDYVEAAYIGAAASLGLMHGTSQGYFEPAAAVKYSDVIKTAVDALNYTPYAVSMGGDESAYFATASKIGINKGVSKLDNGNISRGSFYKLIENVVNTPYLKQVTYSENSDFLAQKDVTILTEFHDIYEGEGIVEADGLTSITKEGKNAGENRLIINGEYYNSEKINVSDLLGYYTEFYYYDNSGVDNTIVYLEKVDNDILELLPDQISSASGMKYTYYNGKTTKTVDFSRAAIIYNGKLLGVGFSSESQLIPSTGSVTLIDNDRSSGYDVVKIDSYTDYAVKKINIEDFTITPYYGMVVDLEDVELDIIDFSTGNSVKFDSISTGCVVSIAESIDGEFAKILVSSNTVTGAIKTEHHENRRTVEIDGEDYTFSDTLQKAIDANIVENYKLNTEGVWLLNAFNEIVFLSNPGSVLVSPDKYEYGILKGAALGKGFDDSLKVKILTMVGEFEVFDVKEKAYVDEVRSKTFKETYDKLCQNGEEGIYEGAVVVQVIRFKINSNREVTHIDRVSEEAKSSGDGLYKYASSSKGAKPWFHGNSRLFDGETAVRADVSIFMAPWDYDNERLGDASDEAYAYKASDYIKADMQYAYIAYKTEADDIAASLIILPQELENGELKKEASDDNLYLFIESRRVLDENGDVTSQIDCAYNGTKYSFKTDPDVDPDNCVLPDGSKYSLKSGDMFRIGISQSTQRVHFIQPAYDYENDRVIWPDRSENNNPGKWNATASLDMQVGTVEKVKDGFLKGKYGAGTETDLYFQHWVDNPNKKLYAYDAETKEYSLITVDDIYDRETYGDLCSRVVIWTLQIGLRSGLIYK